MNIKQAEEYILNHHASELPGGQSGAKVYDIEGKYVFKTVKKEAVGEEIFLAYQKEAKWYQYASRMSACVGANAAAGNHAADTYSFLPEVYDIASSEEEIKLLMKHYKPLDRAHLDDGLLQEIMTVLAKVHGMEIPSFLRESAGQGDSLPEDSSQEEKSKAQLLTEEEIKTSVEGWISVLQEHPDVFGEDDVTDLKGIAPEMNKIIRWHDSEEHVLTHGDFHFDNLLKDEDGNLLICDWQGVNVGAASGDLSFFISRLTGDGIPLEKKEVIECYGRAVKELSGKNVSVDEISSHMEAANLITSFRFWHYYLHGSDAPRVQSIYVPMKEAYDALLLHRNFL
ncbi:MAG: phosphotransferase [Lachnospiraceae bacterium]|nr:phosphotransferase [Lachnospiraceae bacterium]